MTYALGADSEADVIDEVMGRLRATAASGRTRPLAWRIEQLAAIEQLLAERETEIADALGSDLGRTGFDAWLGDIASTRAEAAYARKHLRRWMRPRRTSVPMSMRPGRAFFAYEPLGVVLVIGPWNYQVYLTLGPLIGALAAGNCAVVKPSEHAPATSALLARLLPAYLDPDAVAVVEGDASATQTLLEQGFDHAFFTGGPEIGKLVMAAAAPTLTPVTLELGGKSPAIVSRNADPAIAARRIVWTKFINSGQTCIAPDYVLVDATLKDQFVRELDTALSQMRVGAPRYAPIVNRRQYDRLAGLLAGSGGDIAVGGGTDPATGGIEPTVIVDPDPESPVMQEEIFGPILPVLGTASLDTAIEFVGARPKPLAAYLFSGSRAEQNQATAGINAGGMVINQASLHVLVPSLPFGGVGNSGMGAYHGEWGFQTFSHRKSVLVKRQRPDLSLMYPPYTARTERLLRKVF
ncbi:MAG TPA: aldehyde dehydrogenase family protein [Mycobacteriales bacterium]|jgi:aldehyde dehydrogenase (NAD+)|nr:aldehyde dehydrogenase family protein [Mycobacteriales bacterium]